MTELNDFQLERLTESVIVRMLGDKGFMCYVARDYVEESYTLDDYYGWFQEEPEEESD